MRSTRTKLEREGSMSTGGWESLKKSEKYTELRGVRGEMNISSIGIREQRLILKYMGGIPVQDSNVGWS